MKSLLFTQTFNFLNVVTWIPLRWIIFEKQAKFLESDTKFFHSSNFQIFFFSDQPTIWQKHVLLFPPCYMMDHCIIPIFLNFISQKPNWNYVGFEYVTRVSFTREKNKIHHMVNQTNICAYYVNNSEGSGNDRVWISQ